MALLCGFRGFWFKSLNTRPYRFFCNISLFRNIFAHFLAVSQKNKTFKISRAQSVKLLDLNWSNEKQHKQVSRDIFHFSGEERKPICLRLGKLATNLLIEEYPESIAELERYDDGTSRLRTEVCSFIGVGRFVIGLADDIEVEQSEEFKNYLKTIAEHLISKFH